MNSAYEMPGFHHWAPDPGRQTAVYLPEGCEYSLPRLTTIAQPIDEIARMSVRILTQLLADEPIESQTILFRPTLTARESTAPPR